MLSIHNIQQVNPNNTHNLKAKASKMSSASFVGDQNLSRLSTDNYKAYALSFLGKMPETKASKGKIPESYDVKGRLEDIIQGVNKQYQGKGLYDSIFIDWNKVGWENLKQEPLNWNTMTKEELLTFQHALSLAETKDSSWVKRYNPTNVPEPLATYHVLVSSNAKESHKRNLDYLEVIAKGESIKHKEPEFLHKTLVNPETGKFNLEFCVFDTETTGNRTDPTKGIVDKIIQIGAVKVSEDGEVIPKTAVSQFCNPEMPIHPKAVDVHHITDEMVADKPVIESVLNDFCNNYLQGQMLVAYNAKFDIPMLNRAIFSYNAHSANDITDKPLALCMDPYIILQRIHPFLGASKKLSNQYKFMFGKEMEGAHDALDDVKGTVDVLKYCCYYLQKHANRPLTTKDILTFQFGGKVEGLDIKLNQRGYDKDKSFKQSYRLDAIHVKNFPNGFKITEPKRKSSDPAVITKLTPLIGESNANKLEALKGKEYKTVKAFVENLRALDLTPFGKKSLDEVIQTIMENSVHVINNRPVEVWKKNIRPDHIEKGNDLPDFDICKQIMKEREIQDAKSTGGAGRTLEEVLAEIQN